MKKLPAAAVCQFFTARPACARPLLFSLPLLLAAFSAGLAASAAQVDVALETSEDGVIWQAAAPGFQVPNVPGAQFRVTVVPSGSALPVHPGPAVTAPAPGPEELLSVVLQSSTDLVEWTPAMAGLHDLADGPRFFVPRPALLLDNAEFAAIPAGPFLRGDSLDGMNDAPVREIFVSAFSIQRTEVTKAQWDEVAAWAQDNDYDLTPEAGVAKGTMHPVYHISWYAAVKFANARSEKEGLDPVYFLDGEVYREGVTADSSDDITADFAANGYRLPTEAEWEKAARGGAAGLRFPWDNQISHALANYRSRTSNREPYDVNPPDATHHPDWFISPLPYTAVVGSFAPNGYGLSDMIGNVREWCWDWWYGDYYPLSAETDPAGPGSIPYPGFNNTRVSRGGGWSNNAADSRVAFRGNLFPSINDGVQNQVGFRLVRRP